MNENDEAFVDTIDTRRGADWFRSTLGGSKQIPWNSANSIHYLYQWTGWGEPTSLEKNKSKIRKEEKCQEYVNEMWRTCGEVQVIFETFEPDNHHFDIGVGSVGSGGFGQAAALSLGFFARSVASAYGPTLRRRAFKSLCKMPTDFMTFHFIVCDKQFHLNRLWCLNFKERRDDWHACIPVIAENTSSIIQIWRKRNESEGTGLLSSDGGGWWCGHYKSDLGESVSPIEHSGGAVVNATAVLGGAVIAFTGDVLIGCRKKKGDKFVFIIPRWLVSRGWIGAVFTVFCDVVDGVSFGSVCRRSQASPTGMILDINRPPEGLQKLHKMIVHRRRWHLQSQRFIRYYSKQSSAYETQESHPRRNRKSHLVAKCMRMKWESQNWSDSQLRAWNVRSLTRKSELTVCPTNKCSISYRSSSFTAL